MKKKVIFSLLAICLVAGMVGIGTWAYFSDIETSPYNVFEAGTMDLEVDDENPLTSRMFDISNVAPGDEGVVTAVAENIGSIGGTAFIHLRQTCNNDNGVTEPEDMVDGVLDGSDGTATGDLHKNLYVKISVDGSVIADGSFKDVRSNKLPLGELPAGASMPVVIQWWIPGSVGNIIQGDSLCFDIDFILEQVFGITEFSIGNLKQPSVAIECDDVDISADVTNNGSATGVVTVSCDIDGIHMEKTVAVEAGATVTVGFTTHLSAGSYLVDVSIPEQALAPCPIEVFAPPEVGLDWEEAPAAEIYVCDNIGWVVVAHNSGDVTTTLDVTLTVTVGETVKYTETQTGVKFDPCDNVILTFGPWHAEDDPHEYSGEVIVDLAGVPGLVHSFTLVDEPPTVVNISPTFEQPIAAGTTITVEASATDDVFVAMVAYCIDPISPEDFTARMVFMPYDSETETYKADWDTTGWPLGGHGVVVVAMDNLEQKSDPCITPVWLYGAGWTFTDLSIPNTGRTCDDIPISVDLHNSGNVTGGYSVTVTADGFEHTFSGSLDPCASITLETTLHFDDPGTYTVTFGPLPVEQITLIEPLTWSIGDQWQFDAKYYLEPPELYEDDTEVITVIDEVAGGTEVGNVGYVLPEDCYLIDAVFTEDDVPALPGTDGLVDRHSVIGWVVIDPENPPLTWNSQRTLDEVYREAVVGTLYLEFHWEYLEEDTYGYKATADHGWPFDLGKEWAVHTVTPVHMGSWEGGLLMTVETYGIVSVEGETSVTVPAGTFTVKHVVTWEIELTVTEEPVLDGDGHWIKTGEVGNETWFNDDPVKFRPMYIDRGTYTGEQVDKLELYGNTPASSTMHFEGTLTAEGGGVYTGTIAMTADGHYSPAGGFDVYAEEGGTAYVQGMTPDSWTIGGDHDAYSEFGPWGTWYDPDCADWDKYSLELTADHWYLRYTPTGESPMSGTLTWNGNTGYAAETDKGTSDEVADGGHGPGTPPYGVYPDGGPQMWDWNCGWGYERTPLELPGFAVQVTDLGGDSYHVTLTPSSP